MADISFNCPQCSQKITCDELWGGHTLQCPSCQNSIAVPQANIPAATPIPTAAPPPQAPPALKLGHVAPPPADRPPVSSSRPSQQVARTSTPTYRKLESKKQEKKNVPMMILKAVVGVVAFGTAFYFAYMWASGKQTIFNKKSDEAAKNSDGGEMGHIANLYSVLDATEGAMGGDRGSSSSGSSAPRRARRTTTAAGAADASAETETAGAKPLQLIPPVYNLDVMTAQIPEGKANGMISGTNFVVDVARLDMVGGAPVLSLRQGTNASPDRELIVYLRVKPGEKVAGNAWAVSKEMKGANIPKVTKRWKPNPKFAATTKSFDTGYAMRLQLGEISDGEVTGKIFVSLPDPEQSVVGGIFKAGTTLPDTTNSMRLGFRGGGGGSEF